MRIFTSTYQDAISQYYLKTLPCLPYPSIFCQVLCPLYVVCPHGVALTFSTVVSHSLLSRIQSFSFHPLSHATTLNSTSDFHIIISNWHLVVFIPFDLSVELRKVEYIIFKNVFVFSLDSSSLGPLLLIHFTRFSPTVNVFLNVHISTEGVLRPPSIFIRIFI